MDWINLESPRCIRTKYCQPDTIGTSIVYRKEEMRSAVVVFADHREVIGFR